LFLYISSLVTVWGDVRDEESKLLYVLHNKGTST